MLERRAAIVVWVLWAVGLAWMLFFFLTQTLQPNFWPLVIGIVAQLLASVVAAAAGMWRTLRGPRRMAALGWCLLGVTPLCLWASQLSYTIWFLQGRQLDPNLLIRISRPAGLALADAASRVLYQQRTEGRHVVMIHSGILDSPRKDVALMDEHLQRIQELLGRKMRSKVYWVRGPLLGITARGGMGWALGSPDTDWHEPGRLPYLDLHEAAHAIIGTLDRSDYHVPLDHDVPAILAEGWAETQSNYPDKFLVQRAWNQRRRGLTLSLRELTSRDMYRRHRGPAYDQGSPLVQYILEQFGPETFFELHITCRRTTFEADCQRILGLDLDQLDRAYWNYVKQQMGVDRSGELVFVELAPEVDQTLWSEFVSEHLAAAEQARRLPTRLRATAEGVAEYPGYESSGIAGVESQFVDLLVDGDRCCNVEHYGSQERVAVASPDIYFSLKRDSASEAWELRNVESTGIAQLDCLMRRQSILYDTFAFLGHYGLISGEWAVWDMTSKPLVTHIGKVSRDGVDLVRIAFENRGTRKDYGGGELYVDPGSRWAIRFADLRDGREDRSESHSHFRFELQPQGDEPPLLAAHKIVWKQGETITTVVRMTSRYDFEPEISASDFSPASYGVTLPTLRPTRPPSWYLVVSLTLALLTLFGASAAMTADKRLATRRS